MNGQVLSLEQLDEAFNHLVDVLDRCLCPFVLLGETARSIVKDEKLGGESISVGIREADFNESTKSMLRTISSPSYDIHLGIENFIQDDNGFGWTFKGVPIGIKVIHRKYGFINNPTRVWYYSDSYQVPNPFDKYYKARFLIK